MTTTLIPPVAPGEKAWSAFGEVTCHQCGAKKFIYRGRNFHSFTYQCAGCGTVCHPLTESGACQ